jgi:hypothetical protein
MSVTYWKITKDVITPTLGLGPDWPGREGTGRGSRKQAEDRGITIRPIRLLDDDRELYFEGEAADDDASLIDALAFAAADTGATILQELVGGEWQDVIG